MKYWAEMCVINSIAWNRAFVHVTSYITININIYIQRTTKYFRHIHAITIQSGKDLLGMCNGNLRRLSFRHSAKLHTDFPNQISICYVDDAPASSVGDKWFRPLITLVRLCNMCIVYCKSYDVWQYRQWNMRHVGDDGNELGLMRVHLQYAQSVQCEYRLGKMGFVHGIFISTVRWSFHSCYNHNTTLGDFMALNDWC